MSSAWRITTSEDTCEIVPEGKGAAVKQKVVHLLDGRLVWHLRHEWLELVGGFLAGAIVAGSCVALSLMLTD
jgi:hypothetical protein